MIRRVFGWLLLRLPPGLLLLAAAGVLCVSMIPEAAVPPEELPDYDYLPQARKLAAAGDYEACIQLCEDIVAHELPNAERAIRLLADCERRRSDPLRRGRLIVKGFVTGDASTTEAAAGAIVSDLTLYGDVRDLSVQGWRWASGREPDLFIAVFSAVGLVTEFADWADWLPSMLKACRRAGVLSKKFSKLLLESVRALGSSGAARKSARMLFGDLATLFRKGNFHRAKAVLRGVDSARELKILARAAERSPGQLHLACRSIGAKRLVAALEELPSPKTLRIAARKGPAGVAALRNWHRFSGRRWLKWGARGSKILYSRHAAELVRGVLSRFPELRWGIWAVIGILALAGGFLAFPPLRRRAVTPCPSSGASDAPTSSDAPASRTGEHPPEADGD